MVRRITAVCVFATIAIGCGGDPAAAPTPSPQHTVPAGVIAPVDRARDTVDQLNERQNRMEQPSGGAGYPAP